MAQVLCRFGVGPPSFNLGCMLFDIGPLSAGTRFSLLVTGPPFAIIAALFYGGGMVSFDRALFGLSIRSVGIFSRPDP